MAEKLIKRGGVWYYRFTNHDGRRVIGRVAPIGEQPRKWPPPPRRWPARSAMGTLTPRTLRIATTKPYLSMPILTPGLNRSDPREQPANT